MGNEAGVLDNTASARDLAYYMIEHEGCAVFPVINVPRDELRLCKDKCEIFSLTKVVQEDLIAKYEYPS